MSTNTVTTEKVTLPDGFAKWAKTYFSTQVEPEQPVDLDGLFNDPYTRMRDSLEVQLRNAAKVSALQSKIETQLKVCDEEESVPKLQLLVKEVTEALDESRQRVVTRSNELYEQATRIRLELNPDADTVRSTVRKLVKAWDFDTATATLNTFEKAIAKAKPLDFEDLEVVHKRRAEKFRKENAKFARNTEQGLLAAKRIIDDQGNLVLDGGLLKGLPFVRTDDLASIVEEIEGTDDSSLPQSVHALQMLKRLQTDKTAQEALKQIKAPPDPETGKTEDEKQSLRMAHKLIRNSLGLADDAPITDVEAKRAAVAALLTQVRQVDIGSCFATASAVRVQRNKPEQFLADMGELFTTGKLTREIEHPPGTKLKIEMPISREMVGRKVDVTRKDTNLHLKPNMVAGLDALGIDEGNHKSVIEVAARRLRAERALPKALAKVERFLPNPHTVASLTKTALEKLDAAPAKNIETALQETLSGLMLSSVNSNRRSRARKKLATDACKDFDDVDGSDDFTPQELLEKIGQTCPGGPLSSELVASAKTAYDTSHDNTLMRAWEYTIASMMEKHPDWTGNAREMAGGIGETATTAMKQMAEDVIANHGLTGTAANNERVVVDELSLAFSERLKKELEARYDPGVGGRSEAIAPDGNSSSGGYCLFFRGEKIDGQSGFEAALKTLLEETKQEFDVNALGWPPEYVKKAKAYANQMKDRVETSAFREEVVDTLAERSVGVASTHKDYNEMLTKAKDNFNKPWTKKDGGGDTKIMHLYENRPRPLVTTSTGGYTFNKNGKAVQVTDAEGLTHFIFDSLIKSGVASRIPDGEESGRAVIPVGNSFHAFSLTPGSSDLKIALKQGKKPEDFIKELKVVEGEKNAKRRNAQIPLADLSKGLAAEMIKGAASIFSSDDQPAVIQTLTLHVRGLGVDSISPGQLQLALKNGVRQVLDRDYSNIPPVDREKYATTGSEKCLSPAMMVDRVIPKEEYGPLIDAAMRKLSVGSESQEKIRKDVLGRLRNKDAVVREDLAKEVRIAMRELGLGGGDKDLETAKLAYNALGNEGERIAALKAAGKDVDSPAAAFDGLKEDEIAALREHGVAIRLEAKLDAALVEPRGMVFADLNWGDGDHMTHFSMVVNPLTDELEMWQMNEDGSSPKKMNQDEWLRDASWWIFADPTEYGGALDSHEVTTTSGKKQWEVFRSELKTKLDMCYATKKGDLGKMQRILDVADKRFAESDFENADKAINKLAEELAPLEGLTQAVEQGIKTLDNLVQKVAKEKTIPDAKSAAALLNGLILELKSGVQTAEDLTNFISTHRTLLEYIDQESPFGSTRLVQALTIT